MESINNISTILERFENGNLTKKEAEEQFNQLLINKNLMLINDLINVFQNRANHWYSKGTDTTKDEITQNYCKGKGMGFQECVGELTKQKLDLEK